MDQSEMRSAAEEVDEDQQGDTEMDNTEIRLPDTALRVIFSYLRRKDIKNCRLVSKQWHRFALDNAKFILSIRHIEPQLDASATNKVADMNQHRNHVALVPFRVAQTDVRAMFEYTIHKQRRHESAKTLSFEALAEASSEINHKIKGFVFRTSKSMMLPVLKALTEMFPSATNAAATTNNYVDHAWAFLEKQTVPASQDDRPMKCRRLVVLQELELEHFWQNIAHPVAYQLLTSDASFIEKITADWNCLKKMFNKFEQNNNCQTLVLEKCRELLIVMGSLEHTGGLTKIVRRFPNLQVLNCSIDDDDPAGNNTRSLEQLANLKSLSLGIRSAIYQPQAINTLHLLHLTKLALGDNVLLPENPRHFALSGLDTLKLHARAENMQRLTARAQLGGGNFSNLTTLILYQLTPELVDPFLRIVLTAAPKLATLRTTMQNASVDCITTVSTLCDVVAQASPGLAAIEVGTFKPPAEYDCRGLLQQLIDGIKQRALKATIALDFDNVVSRSLDRAISEAEVGGGGVTVARRFEKGNFDDLYDLTWRNSGTGNQQKLKIRVKDWLFMGMPRGNTYQEL